MRIRTHEPIDEHNDPLFLAKRPGLRQSSGAFFPIDRNETTGKFGCCAHGTAIVKAPEDWRSLTPKAFGVSEIRGRV